MQERVTAAAAQGRAALVAGATVQDILETMRADGLRALEVMEALCAIEPIDLVCAKEIVSTFCEGRSYAQLHLSDLELLADAPRVGVDFFTRRHRDHAIIERQPYLLYARKSAQSTYVIRSHVPLPFLPSPLAEGQYGSRSGSTAGFDTVREEALDAAAAWPSEIEIVRDDTDELLLRFVRAPSLVR